MGSGKNKVVNLIQNLFYSKLSKHAGRPRGV